MLALTRHSVRFELYNPYGGVRLSEVLEPFHIVINEETIYRGRASVVSVTGAGLVSVVEVSLLGPWNEMDGGSAPAPASADSNLWAKFSDWRRSAVIEPAFKDAVGRMRFLLADFREWIGANPHRPSRGWGLEPSGAASWTGLVSGFACDLEHSLGLLADLASNLPVEARASHRAYAQRELHPLMREAPFFRHANDHPAEIPVDGGVTRMVKESDRSQVSRFGRILEASLLRLTPRHGPLHEERLVRGELLDGIRKRHSSREPVRVLGMGGRASLNLRRILEGTELSRGVDLTLLQDVGSGLAGAARQPGRGASPEVSAMREMPLDLAQLVRGAVGPEDALAGPEFDCIVCSGLMEYLPDRLCRRVTDSLFGRVRSGGALLVGNVRSLGVFGFVMDYLLDWHVNQRTERQMREFLPPSKRRLDWQLSSDEKGETILLKVRKDVG